MFKRHAVPTTLLAVLLIGCADDGLTDLETTAEPVAVADALASAVESPAPVCETLTFNFPPWTNGQQIEKVEAATLGLVLEVSSDSWVNDPYTFTHPFVFSTDLDPTLWEPNDLLWRTVGGQVGKCTDCQGLGQVIVIGDERGFSAGGVIEGRADSRYGGDIIFSGFPTGAGFYIGSFKVIDHDGYPDYVEPSFKLIVGGNVVGESVLGPDGNVQTVTPSPHLLDGTAVFRIGGGVDQGASGAIDDIEICQLPSREGDEGCTPGYWKNHPDAWTGTGYAPNQLVTDVFTVPFAHFSSTTLVQALQGGGGRGVVGKTKILLRAAVAALLNSTGAVDYPLTTAEVIAQVNAAIASNDASTIVTLATALDEMNNLGCPLD